METDSHRDAPHWFTTTHWSVVLAAKEDASASPESQQALERLCGIYWYPLYAYARRKGYDTESAKDLTQGLFARLFERNDLANVQRDKGKFRSFLLASLNHFMSDEWDKARAQKRGGDKVLLSLDESSGEERYRLEPADNMDPEKLFERRWALTLLDQALERLKENYTKTGKSELYEALKVFALAEPNAPTYVQLAAQLGRAEGTIKSDVSRLRENYREMIREQVAHTVSDPAEIDDEIRYLIRVISG